MKSQFTKQLKPRYNGIFAAARALGVTHQHLRLVLNGVRESRRLLTEVRRRFPGLLSISKES